MQNYAYNNRLYYIIFSYFLQWGENSCDDIRGSPNHCNLIIFTVYHINHTLDNIGCDNVNSLINQAVLFLR